MNTQAFLKNTIMTTFLMTTILCFVIGCGKLPEKRHPLVLKATKFKEKGSYPEAARFYEEYLMKNPTSFQIHQDVASLYFDYLNDPYMAVYHYRQCLKYLPEKTDDKHIREWLSQAEKKYFEELKTQYSDANEEVIKQLKDKLFNIENQNTKLKHYLALYVKRYKDLSAKLEEATKNKPIPVSEVKLPSRPSSETPAESATATATETPATTGKHSFYVVEKGDTLIKISKKVYGTTKYYQLIFDANKGILPSMSKLSLGQRLVIPELSESATSKTKDDGN